MKKIVKIVGILFVVIFICVFIGRVCTCKNTRNGNIANWGLAVKNKDIIYYNKYGDGIFSVKNGKETKISDENAYCLTASDNRIYYLTVVDFNNIEIKYIETKGQNITKVANVYSSISKFFVENEKIYYYSNKENALCRMDAKAQNQEILVEGLIKDFYVENGEIFYINEESQICKLGTQEPLNEHVYAQKMQMHDNWIYYYNEKENALFRLSCNGNKNELVSILVKNETYNICGKYVYYFDNENSKIARMKIGSSNKCDDIAQVNVENTQINIVGDELYYLDKSRHESSIYQMFRVKVDGKNAKNIEY